MSRVICIANQKGGSAKTSTAVNLACAFAATRRKVLLIDFDPQGNATVSLNLSRATEDSLVGVLIANNDQDKLIVHYEVGHFDVIPSSEDLIALVVALYELEDKNLHLKYYLDKIRDCYDLIIIDCPPNTSLITANAICASDYLLVPMPCEFFALDSLNATLDQFDDLNLSGDASCVLLGILRTMYEENDQLSVKISDTLKDNFKDLLLTTVIPFSSRISEASSLGKPVLLYDKSSSGAFAYLTLAGELLQKIK